MIFQNYRSYFAAFSAAGALALGTSAVPAAAAWEPTRTVEFIIPAGTGGGADQMARMIQGIVQKHNLMPRSEEHTSELQSRQYLVCRLLLEKKKKKNNYNTQTELI